MKKIISILVCIAISIPFGVFTHAETGVEVQSEVKGILNALAITDESYYADLNQQVTRDEFVNMVAKTLNVYQTRTDQMNFADVDKSSAANQLFHMGLVNGIEKGMFAPRATIKTEHGIKIMVNALGYGRLSLHGASYLETASSLKLLKNVDLSSQTLTRICAANLIFNALVTQPLIVKGYKGQEILYEKSQDDLLYTVHKVRKDNGELIANEYTSLTDTNNAVKKNCVNINDVIYQSNNPALTRDLLAYDVNFYYRDDEVTEKTILYIEKRLNNLQEITILKEDFISFDGRKLTYESNARTEEIDFKAPLIFVNGIPNYNSSLWATPFSKYIAVDKDSDKNYDMLFIYKQDTVVVSDINKTEQYISDLFTGVKLDLMQNSNNIVNIYKDGKLESINSLNKDDVLTLVTKDTPKVQIKDIYINNKQISGMVTEKETNAIYINNQKYKMNSSFQDYMDAENILLDINDDGTFYLNNDGEVAYAVLSSANETKNYAYIMKVSADKGLSDKLQMKLILMDGKNTAAVFELADRITIDGVDYKKRDDIESALKSTAAAVRPDLSAAPMNDEYSMLIAYKLNSQNQIYEIDTPYVTPELEDAENSLTIGLPYSKCKDIPAQPATPTEPVTKEKKFNYLFNEKNKFFYFIEKEDGVVINQSAAFGVTGNTKTLIVPVDRAYEEGYAEKAIKYYYSFTSAKVEAYDVNEMGIAKLLVLYTSDQDVKISLDSPVALISKITQTVDSEGVKCHKVTLFGTSETTIMAKDDIIMASYKQGDVIQYSTDNEGRINDVRLRCHLGSGPVSPAVKSMGDRSDYEIQYKMIYGTALSKDESVLSITPTNVNSGGIEPNNKLFGITLSGIPIIVYDPYAKENEIVKKGSVSDIDTYKNFGDGASKLLIYTRYGLVKFIIVDKS